MQCPACSNKLESAKYKKNIIDFCPACEGIWFDKGELQDTLDHLMSTSEVNYQTAGEALSKPTAYKKNEHPIRKCPRCSKDMKTFNYSYDSNVFIDKCPACKGIWTDKDEIRQIAKYNKGNPKVDAMGKAIAIAHKKHIEYKIENERLADDFGRDGRFSIFKLAVMRLSLLPIPLRDENPISIKPIATLALIIFNVIIFLSQLFFVQEPEVYVKLIGLVPANAFHADRLFAFVSSMFVHANIIHLIGNMYFLWLFGDNIEDEWGSVGFLFFYLICGIAGSLMFIGIYPALTVPCVGASGAISGIMGAYIMLHPHAIVRIFWLGRVRGVSAFGYLLYWILFQSLFGLIEIFSGISSYIGYWAHFGGFFCGALIAFIVSKINLHKH